MDGTKSLGKDPIRYGGKITTRNQISLLGGKRKDKAIWCTRMLACQGSSSCCAILHTSLLSPLSFFPRLAHFSTPFYPRLAHFSTPFYPTHTKVRFPAHAASTPGPIIHNQCLPRRDECPHVPHIYLPNLIVAQDLSCRIQQPSLVNKLSNHKVRTCISHSRASYICSKHLPSAIIFHAILALRGFVVRSRYGRATGFIMRLALTAGTLVVILLLALSLTAPIIFHGQIVALQVNLVPSKQSRPDREPPSNPHDWCD